MFGNGGKTTYISVYVGVRDVEFVTRLADFMWFPWLLGLFILVGLYLSVRTGFFQLFGIRRWLGDTAGSLFRAGRRQGTGITRLQVLATALASTIGTGSVAGVATAIWFGGPGAVFWMWVSALLGMMTGCAEKILTLCWRRLGPDGNWQGGPMYYISQGMHSRFLAGWFAIACVGGSLVGGGMVQTNAIVQSFDNAFGAHRLLVGVVVAVLAGMVLVGGIGRIAGVSQLLMPAMALLFLGSAVAVLWLCRSQILDALELIVKNALTPQAAAGGVGVAAALRYGVARGVFTNEAGMGSTAIAHANADTKQPGEQGMWGMFEVFFATLIVCTATALVILCAGVYAPATVGTGADVGVSLAADSFGRVLGPTGAWIVEISVVLFAFSSVLGWSYYGQAAVDWLFTGRWNRPVWLCAFLAACVLGSIVPAELVWQLVDLFTALMALPNLTALLWLSPQALRELQNYLKVKETQ